MVPILEVSHLSKHYKNLKAVDDLSFSVNEGDVYGFLGQNGAGKSTTIRMMLSLISTTGGSISIFGKELSHHRKEVLANIGAIIERPDVYKYLTAFENLSLFAKISGKKITRSQLMQQLEMVGLVSRAGSKVKDFSQGMKQRMGIAIALIHDPKLIILDEPTNGLDPQGIADMRNLILRLSRQMGKTVIVSSHLLSEIEVIANRMLVIHKGKKIAEGNVREMLDPSKTIVLFETTDNNSAATIISNLHINAPVSHHGAGLQVQMNKQDIPATVNKLTNAGIGVMAVQPRHSLEAYFLSLTNNDTHVEPFTN